MRDDEVSIDTPTVADMTTPTQSGHAPTPPPAMIEGRYALRQLLGKGGWARYGRRAGVANSVVIMSV